MNNITKKTAFEMHDNAKSYYERSQEYGYKFLMALKKIRDEKLFYELGVASFDEYTKNNFGYSKNTINERIAAANEWGNDYDRARGQYGDRKTRELAQLPFQERIKAIDKGIETDAGLKSIASATTREVEEYRRKLKLAESEKAKAIEQAEKYAEQVIELKSRPQPKIKEVVKEIEVAPADYDATKSLNATLLEKNSKLKREYDDLNSRAEFIEEQYNKLVEERKAVDEKSAKYDELTEAIKQSQGQLNEAQAKIGSYKSLLSFIRKGNEMVVNMGGLVYVDEQRILHSDSKVRNEFEQLQKAISRLAEDMGSMLKETEVLEGEII